MNKAEKQKIISELKDFYKKLKTYNRYTRPKAELSETQIRYRDNLREKLVYKSGVLKTVIVQLTGKQYYTQFGERLEIWNTGLSPSGYLPVILTARGLCIDATNEAIGKLELDIQPVIRNKQETTIEKPQKFSSEPPKTFIAHGGESPALRNLKSFLEALGVQPLVVEEQPSEGRSIAENVDHYARQADCAIILATKGDIDGKTGGFIPRGNVLMEIGKLQEIFKDRIIYLLQAGVKFPTNVSEKVRERFTSQSMDRAFIAIARELTEMKILKAVKP